MRKAAVATAGLVLGALTFLSGFESVAAASLKSDQVSAQIPANQDCSTDYLGNMNCSGTVGRTRTSNSCSTDYLGNMNCSGTVGRTRTSNSCSTDYLGNMNCSGTVGRTRTSSTCYKDFLGNTKCSVRP